METLDPIAMEPSVRRAGSARKRGRPLEMAPSEVLRRIRDAYAQGTLFRMHHEHPGLYARARRLFGTWAAAVAEAGVDHDRAVADARRRSLEARRRARANAAR
jgi:hypothetical protein